MDPTAPTPRALAILLLTALSLVVVSCPRQPPAVEGPVQADRLRAACPEALELMAHGRYDQAVELLQTRNAENRGLASDPRSDLCLGRALIGAGSHPQAINLLLPLLSDQDLDQTVRSSACLYGAWATAGSGDLVAAAHQLDGCSATAELDPQALLLPGDEFPTSLLLLDAVSRRPDPEAGLSLANRLLGTIGTSSPAGRAWVLERAFAMAKALDDEELDRLAGEPEPFFQAVAAYGRLFLSVQDDPMDRAVALAPEVRARLTELDATGALLEVEEWLRGDETYQPALIGAVLGLSGPFRRDSRAVMAGLLLAQKAFDPGIEQHSRLLIRDTGETEQTARDAITSLDEQGALAVIVFGAPQLMGGILQEAQQRGLPCIALTSDPLVLQQGSSVFRFFADPRIEGRVLASFAQEEGVTHLAILLPIPTSDYLDQLVTSFAEEARTRDIEVDQPLQYALDDLQREAQTVSQILALREFDGLLIADTGDHALTLAAYLGVQDIWAREPGQEPSGTRRQVLMLGNSFWHDPEFLASGPDYLAGGVFPTWLPLEMERPAAVSFAEQFGRVYARRPTALDAFAHDALLLLRFLLLDSDLRTRGGISEALERIEGVQGATGEIHFGPEHTNSQQPGLLRVTSQGFVPQ